MSRRLLALLLLVGGGLVALAAAAFAFWTATASSNATATGDSFPSTPAAPTVTFSGGTASVTFAAVSTGGGIKAAAYDIKRYDTLGSMLVKTTCTPGSGSTVTCTESSVPTGTWQYSYTPRLGTNWVGNESAKTSSTYSATKLVVTSAAVSGLASSSATLGPLVVELRDATNAAVTPGAPLSVNLSSSSTGGVFAATSGGTAVTSVTIGSSATTATFYYGDTKSGSPTVTAAAGSLASATQVETISPGAASKLAFSTQPSASGVAGVAFGTQPVVTVQDALGNAVTSDSSSVTLAITSGTGTSGASLTCTANPKSAASGSATFAGCSLDKSSAAAYTLTATDGSLTSATSSAITVNPGAASKVVFVTQPSATATAGTAFVAQPAVAVQDALGNVVTSDTSSVSLAITSGTGVTGASLSCTANPKVASSGTATFSGCSIDKSSNSSYTLTATDGTLTSATSSAITVSPGTPTKLVFTSSAVSGISNSTPALGPITVQLQDALNNPVPVGSSTTVNLSSTSGGGAFSATSGGSSVSSVSITSGNSTATFFYGDTRAGSPTITAAAISLTGTQTEAITASKFAVSAPTGAVAGAAFAVTVTAQDASGQTATNYVGSHTLSFSTTAGASPSGATPTLPISGLTFVNGVATANATLVKVETGRTITAAESGITGTSGSINVTANTASRLCFTQNSVCSGGASLSVAKNTNATFTVYLADASGNAVAAGSGGVTVALALPTGNSSNVGSLSAASVTIAQGASTSSSVTWSAPNGAGKTVTITATSGSLTSGSILYTTT